MYQWYNTCRVDQILRNSNGLPKSHYFLYTLDLPLANKLPMSVAVSNYNIPVDILEFKTEITHLKIEDAFLQKVTQDRPEEIIFLIFIG